MRPSIYEFAGGDAAFLALARAHHARCVADPELNHPFSHPGQHPQHVERLAAYWGEVMGGPPAYSSGLGGQSALLRMHSGNGDMSDLGRRFVDCFAAAMDDVPLPADERFRATMRDYMVWATGEFISYPDGPAGIADAQPVPRWTWEGLQSS
jgi:hemoglobin